MQVNFPAEDKLEEGKAGVFISKKTAFREKKRWETEKLVFHTVIQLFLSL